MAKKYDPVKAHEYYMKHRKLKGRKKKKKKAKKVTYASMVKNLEKSLNAEGQRQAEIEKQKLENEKQDLNKALSKKWNDQIKDLKKKLETATEEEKDQIKTQIATMQVDYKAEKKLVKNYFDMQYLNVLNAISNNKSMRV